jgi:hypothetical protein
MVKYSRKRSTKRRRTTRKSIRKKSIKRSTKKKPTQNKSSLSYRKEYRRKYNNRKIKRDRERKRRIRIQRATKLPVYTINNLGDLKEKDIIQFTYNNDQFRNQSKQVILYIKNIDKNIITGILFDDNHAIIQKKPKIYDFNNMSNVKILTNRGNVFGYNEEEEFRPIEELQALPHEYLALSSTDD